jgi:tetratricopeptide (TPR) repeat protein
VRPAEEQPGSELRLRALRGRAETLDLVGRHRDAIIDYNALIESCVRAQQRIEAHIGLHRIYSNMGEGDKAADFAKLSLKASREHQNHEFIGVSLTSLTFSLIHKGAFSKALAKAKEALLYLKKAAKKQGLSLDERRRIKSHLADGFNCIGHIKNQQGKYRESLRSFGKGLKLVEEAGNQIGMVTFLNNIGWNYKLLNDHKHAISFFNRAMEISKKIGFKNAIATIVGNLGLIYHDEAEFDKALNCFQEALDINRGMGSLSGMGIDMNNMGNVYLDRKELGRARNVFLKSLEIFERIGYRFGTAMVLNNLGIIYLEMGEYKKSVAFVKRSEKLVAESGIAEIGMRNTVLRGRILRETGKLQESLELLQKAIKDADHFGVKEIFIHAAIAYVETVCAGKLIFPERMYSPEAASASLLQRAEMAAKKHDLGNLRKDIASAKKKWESTVAG